VAVQLEQTDALLNKYIGILSTSEEFSRLMFDEQWQGAEAVTFPSHVTWLLFTVTHRMRRHFYRNDARKRSASGEKRKNKPFVHSSTFSESKRRNRKHYGEKKRNA